MWQCLDNTRMMATRVGIILTADKVLSSFHSAPIMELVMNPFFFVSSFVFCLLALDSFSYQKPFWELAIQALETSVLLIGKWKLNGIVYMPVSKTTCEILCCALSVVDASFSFSISDQRPVSSSLSPLLCVVFAWLSDDQEVAYLMCFPRCDGLLLIKCALAVGYTAACFVFCFLFD